MATSLSWVTVGASAAAAATTIVNGGFEEGATGWTTTGSVTTNRAHTGSRSWVATDTKSLTQTVTVPANGTLRYFWAIETNDLSVIETVTPEMHVFVMEGGRADTLQVHSTKGPENTWQYATLHLGAYAGRQVDIIFQTYDFANWESTWWILDDVSIDALPPQWHDWAPLDPLHGLTGSPEAVSSGPGKLDVFGRTTDGNVVWRAFDGFWQTWKSLGAPVGGIVADPAAVSSEPGRLDVFVRSAGNIFQKTYASGAWTAWIDLGPAQGSGSPDVTSWGPGRMDLVVRGADGNLWQKVFTNGAWSRWVSLGAPLLGFLGNPGAVSWGPGRLDVFARGTAGNLVQKYFSNGWKPWASLGNPLLGIGLGNSPDAASWGTGRLDVLVRGTDGNLWQKTHSSGWKAWSSLSAPPPAFGSDPGVVSRGAGRLDVFVRGNDGKFWQRTYA